MKKARYLSQTTRRDNRILQDITKHLLETLECTITAYRPRSEDALVSKLKVGMSTDQTLVVLSMAVRGMPEQGIVPWYIRLEYRRCDKSAIPSLKDFTADPNTVRNAMPLVRAYRVSQLHKTPYSESK